MRSILFMVVVMLLAVQAQVFLPHRMANHGVGAPEIPTTEWTNNLGNGGPGYIGEHPIITNAKVYVAMYAYPVRTNGGLAILDAEAGTLIQRTLITDTNTDSAPAIDANGKIHLGSLSGNLYRIHEASNIVEETLTGLRSGYDVESTVLVKGTNVVILPGSGGVALATVTNYTVRIWTNTSATFGTGSSPTSVCPGDGGYLYVPDGNCVLWKINTTNGTTSASFAPGAGSATGKYFSPTYDADHDRIFHANGTGKTIYCINPASMTSVWSTVLAYIPFRCPVYYNNRLFVESRNQDGTTECGTFYCLNATTGAIVWTNNYFLNKNAAINSVIADDTYLYANAATVVSSNLFHRTVVLDQTTGSFVTEQELPIAASSGISQTWRGALVAPLWGQAGILKMRVRSTGGTNAIYWRQNDSHTSWDGTNMAGSILYPYPGQTLTNGIISYWRLDESSGTRVDVMGTNSLGSSNSVTSVAGVITNAASFAAASSQFLGTATNTTARQGNYDFTLAGWFRLRNKPGGPLIVAGQWGASGNFGFSLQWQSAPEGLYFYTSTNGVESSTRAAYVATLTTNTWYFFVAQHDSVNKKTALIINETSYNTASVPSGVFQSTMNFYLGARGDAGSYWNGEIDEVGWWKRLLTGTERSALYNAGAARTYPFVP